MRPGRSAELVRASLTRASGRKSSPACLPASPLHPSTQDMRKPLKHLEKMRIVIL